MSDLQQLSSGGGEKTQRVALSELREKLYFECCTLSLVAEPGAEPYLFSKDIIRIGAHQESDLVLSDETVSRHHCELRRDGESYRLIDEGSTNGSFVGKLRVFDALLYHNCEFSVGGTRLRFQLRREEAPIDPRRESHYGELIGAAPAMRKLYGFLDRVAPTDLSLVIEGETGTGKELVARALHQRSQRASAPLVVCDCSAIPEHLIESELFGHEKGAFSGAVRSHKGVFEQAHRGTLFLDELGELDISLQPKLLRVLETGTLRRVGGERSIQIDVRIVSATNRRLEEMVKAGTFRSDLYYRLAKVQVKLPPLRERGQDVVLIARSFLEKSAQSLAGSRLSSAAEELLLHAHWPGNVRELRNIIDRVMVFSEGPEISAAELRPHLKLRSEEQYSGEERAPGSGGSAGTTGTSPPPLPRGGEAKSGPPPLPSDPQSATPPPLAVRPPPLPAEGTSLKEAKESIIADFEREYLVRLLQKHNSNVSAVAREAGIDRRHVYRLLEKYELSPPRATRG